MQTLKCLRSGLARHFKTTKGFDSIKDSPFIKSNEMFKGVTVQSKKNGKGVRWSYPAITEIEFLITIDDNILAKILYETEQNLNQINSNNKTEDSQEGVNAIQVERLTSEKNGAIQKYNSVQGYVH